MEKKIYSLIFSIFILLSTPFQSFAQESINAGFINGIWFSKFPFFANEQIRIYTAFQNNSGFDLVGEIHFFDNNQFIGKKKFSSINGRLIESWIDWMPKQGNHKITVKLKEIKIAKKDGTFQEIQLPIQSKISEKEYFVDIDTDKDGIGNQQDKDDDNDGLTDKKEIMLGTNPLKKDTDEDKLPDKKEIELGTNPLKKDTDNDGVSDYIEVQNHKDPLDNLQSENKTKFILDAKNLIFNSIDKIKSKPLTFISEEQQKRKEELTKKIEELKEKNYSSKDILLSNFSTYAYFWFLSLIKFILESNIILTIISLGFLYYLFKFILKRLLKK